MPQLLYIIKYFDEQIFSSILHRGSYVYGPNGAGKSTLVRILATLQEREDDDNIKGVKIDG